MSINVNNGYERFYKGTEPIKKYGSGGKGKDKLVRYEFNTTDEHGNKVMDKMSREETLQAMKAISAQYGDDTIVEFSGNGMAALVESKKSGHGPDLDKIMVKTSEQRVIPDDMVTQLEGTYRRVSKDDEINTNRSWHDTLKEKAPDVCNELDDLMQQILEHGLNHNNDGEKFGKRFVELIVKAEKAISAYDAKTQGVKNTTAAGAKTDNTTRKTAADELSYLSKKYGNYSILAANYSKGMKYGSNSTVNVAISPQFLSKMANDPKLEKEYESYLADMQKLDAQEDRAQAAKGWHVVARGWVIDKDGGISKWGIVEKDNKKSHLQTMSENAEKIRKQNEEKKREKAELEEKRQASREEKEKLQEKLDEAGKEQFGDKWKGVAVIDKDDENAVVPKTDKDNAGVTGLNMDIKA